MTEALLKKYRPMTETTYYTLLAVTEPRHGYAIMQFVSRLTEGRIRLGTGTLYTMTGRLMEDGLIDIVSQQNGKKTYQITEMGREVLRLETERLEYQLDNGLEILGKGEPKDGAGQK
ncbi:PadR family transcriptional regulator [Lacrimispora sp. NSJ-141]|uniref:PadR family transcriptional regulator n=1 Tax=Lientehia hominis TaxID=2897778 RepID=A0AAP2RJ32_9FIRM|nr:PadR family transcriptional regulator [Lientehia hominis]